MTAIILQNRDQAIIINYNHNRNNLKITEKHKSMNKFGKKKIKKMHPKPAKRVQQKSSETNKSFVLVISKLLRPIMHRMLQRAYKLIRKNVEKINTKTQRYSLGLAVTCYPHFIVALHEFFKDDSSMHSDS